MTRKISGWLIATLTFVSIFGTYPPNKHGTIISYAQDNLASPSNAEYNEPEETDKTVSKATPSNAEKEQVYIKQDAEKIDIDDLSNVSILDMAKELDMDSTDDVAVKIPVKVSLEGYSTETSFEIEVIGTMSEDSILSIVPASDFELKSVFKKGIAGHVELEQEEVYQTDLEESGRTTINGTIKLDSMITAGKWDGDFNISVSLVSPELEDIEWEYLQSLDEEELEEELEEIEIATDSNASRIPSNEIENSEALEKEEASAGTSTSGGSGGGTSGGTSSIENTPENEESGENKEESTGEETGENKEDTSSEENSTPEEKEEPSEEDSGTDNKNNTSEESGENSETNTDDTSSEEESSGDNSGTDENESLTGGENSSEEEPSGEDSGTDDKEENTSSGDSGTDESDSLTDDTSSGEESSGEESGTDNKDTSSGETSTPAENKNSSSEDSSTDDKDESSEKENNSNNSSGSTEASHSNASRESED